MTTHVKSTSPNGRYILRLSPWEVRMSHWIERPELIDSLTQQRLVHFVDDTWSLESAEWRSDTVLTVKLRKYPGDHVPPVLEVTIDCQHATATVGAQSCALSSLEQVLESVRALGSRHA